MQFLRVNQNDDVEISQIPMKLFQVTVIIFLGTQILKKQQLRHEAAEPELGTMRHLQYNPNLRSQSYVDRSSRNASPAPTPSQPMRNLSHQPGAITPDRPTKYDHRLNNGHAIGAYSPEEVT